MRRQIRGRGFAVSMASAFGLFSTQAGAQGQPPISVPDTTHPLATPPTDANANEQSPNEPDSYWARGEARTFASTAIDVGYLYLRPRVSLGYGKPFFRSIGIDANPQVSQTFLGGYAGIRASIPFLEFRAGARYIWAFQRQFLLHRSSYDRLQLEARDTARSQYIAGEAELTGTIPVGFGAILATGSVSYVTGIPKEANGVPTELNVYEETLRVIIKPPWVWRGRLGYAVRLGIEGRVSLGIVMDVIGVPGRSREIIRAGIVGAAALSDHLEVLGSFVPPIFSPDSIGFAGGDFGQLGIRYRWATDQPPETPAPRKPREPEAEKKKGEQASEQNRESEKTKETPAP